MRTGKWRDGGIAWGVVLAWHVLFAWMLVRTARVEHLQDDADALQVVYITAPAAITRLPRPSDAHPRRRVRDKPSQVATIATIARASRATQPVDRKPLSAVFLDEAHTLAQQQAPITFAAREPFASRPTQLPGAGTGRFRMQPQRSPRDLVAAVGGYLFAPKGYESDPCPRNRENIGRAMAGQDPQARQQELDFERRHCRP